MLLRRFLDETDLKIISIPLLKSVTEKANNTMAVIKIHLTTAVIKLTQSSHGL